MIEPPWITDTEAFHVAAIHLLIPREEIRHVMTPALDELAAVLDAQGVIPTGPWLTHHYEMKPEVFDFEVCMPVASPVASSGRVRASEIPASKVARTIYEGGYAGIGNAWRELDNWIRDQSLTPGPDRWERYLMDTASQKRTELNRPLISL
jgi:effector-binding domain-containing protein